MGNAVLKFGSSAAFAIIVVALIVTATVVGGFVLHHLVSSIPFEFACGITGLAQLTAFAAISAIDSVSRLLLMASSLKVAQQENEHYEDEELAKEEFAEHIAMVVYEKLDPQRRYQQRQHPKHRR